MDGKLNIQLQEPLSILTKYVPDLKVFHNSLEPIECQSEQEVMEVLYAENEIWGSFLDEVRTLLFNAA